MKKTLIAAGIIAAFSMPVMAQEAKVIDTNEDGYVTMEELQAAYPNLEDIAQLFGTLDADADGLISDIELKAAMDANLLPERE